MSTEGTSATRTALGTDPIHGRRCLIILILNVFTTFGQNLFLCAKTVWLSFFFIKFKRL